MTEVIVSLEGPTIVVKNVKCDPEYVKLILSGVACTINAANCGEVSWQNFLDAQTLALAYLKDLRKDVTVGRP
jgi:hypothetical protein